MLRGRPLADVTVGNKFGGKLDRALDLLKLAAEYRRSGDRAPERNVSGISVSETGESGGERSSRPEGGTRINLR